MLSDIVKDIGVLVIQYDTLFESLCRSSWSVLIDNWYMYLLPLIKYQECIENDGNVITFHDTSC